MITQEQPSVSPTGRYSVIETMGLLGIGRTCLEKYSRIPVALGGIAYGVRKCNGRRFYTGSEIVRWWRAQL